MPKIHTIHRYPVKSMFGEELAEARIEKGGLAGDRRWAVYNVEEGEIQGGRNLPLLLTLRAEYLREPAAADSGAVRVIFPDGRSIETDRAIESPELNDYLGKRVRLCPIEPAHNLAHYRRRITAAATNLDEQMGVEAGEQKADFSAL